MELVTEQETMAVDTMAVDPMALDPLSRLPQLAFELRDELNDMYAEWREENPGSDVIDWAEVLRRPSGDFMYSFASLVNAGRCALWDEACDDRESQASLVSMAWADVWNWFSDRNKLVAKAAGERRQGKWGM